MGLFFNAGTGTGKASFAMPQGKFKGPKAQIPGKKKANKATKTDKNTLRKGSFKIAPKKKKLREANSVKKGLEQAIRVCIEDELTQKTKALEPKALAMLKNKPSS